MNDPALQFSRFETRAGAVGVIALIAAGILIWREPGTWLPAWRCATLVWMGPALGSLVFILIHQVSDGEWGRALRPFLRSSANLLPWFWLLVLPLLWTAWRTDETGGGWRYASPAALAARTVLTGIVFFFFTLMTRRAGTRWDGVAKLNWVGPSGLIIILFVTHFFASDWLAALDPRWHSTAFPLVWLVGQGVAGLALAVIGAIATGTDLARMGRNQRILGIDVGSLLFAAAMTWCYVAFAQFLIVWSGNLPEETGWFTRRLLGIWRFVPLVLVAVHFIAPLFVLLSRKAKQNPRALAVVAAMLFGGQTLHTLWIILPGFPKAPPATALTALALMTGFGALFLRAFAVGVRRELAA